MGEIFFPQAVLREELVLWMNWAQGKTYKKHETVLEKKNE